MYLTKTDLIGAIDEQNKFYEILLDVLKDGTMFFIGYSFRDLLYLNIVQKASKKFGIENLTYSYALFPHPENMNEVEINRLKEYRIIPIAMDFNSFFQLIDSKFDHRKLNYNYFKDKTIKTLKSTIIVPYREAESYLSQFNFLFEELINDEPSTKEDFFKGKDLTWGPFNKHWDFERFWYSNEKNFNLKFKVELLLKNYNDEIFNKILLITGIPGIGKTIIAKRLAYDIYKE